MNTQTSPMWLLKLVALILLAVLSFTVFYSFFTTDSYKYPMYSYLDGKKTTVVGLAAAATAASAAITMLPGDVGTPIADKLAEISTYTIVILCAIFLEKYLVTITGAAAFKVLIPIACLLLIVNLLFLRWRRLRQLGLKLICFAVIIVLTVPVSVTFSRSIEDTYQETIQATIDTANEDAQEIQDSQEQGLLESLIKSIKGGVSAFTKKFEITLTNMIEAISVLIVTSCLIPLLVFVFFSWIIKMFFNLEVPTPLNIPFLDKNEKNGNII